MIQLLSPAGDYNSAISAIQNGCDAIYFGSKNFSARSSAQNFEDEELKNIIEYAKLRGVKTYLTLNTLLTNSEFEQAFDLIQQVYCYGVDGVIVQDIGFANVLIKTFQDLEIVASTQMSINNLDGTLFVEKQGFKRVVLARELSTDDISYISKNSDIELEVFGHGALCIGLSGQCSFSSLIGGRSANRGKCAGPCRMKYTLVEKDKKTNTKKEKETKKELNNNGSNEHVLDTGYLLSSKDIQSINYLPDLIKAGVSSLKIEGRMKNPVYTGATAKIYKKYLKLAQKSSDTSKYFVEDNDKQNLIQVFNRGGNSCGHLYTNDNLIYKQMPNNSGIFLGKIEKYTGGKYIFLKTNTFIENGDKIAIEGIEGSYTISELLKGNTNIEKASSGMYVSIGRIKGNVKLGAKVFKLSNKQYSDSILENMKHENRKIPFDLSLTVRENMNVKAVVKSASNLKIYDNLEKEFEIDLKPIKALNKPITKEDLIQRFSKTKDSPFYFKNFDIIVEDNLFLTKVSKLNELKRNILEYIEEYGKNNIQRTLDDTYIKPSKELIEYELEYKITKKEQEETKKNEIQISLYPKVFDNSFNYLRYKKYTDTLYVNIFSLLNKETFNKVSVLAKDFKVFVVFPPFLKQNIRNVILNLLTDVTNNIQIQGFVLSNLGDFNLLKELNLLNRYTLVANTNMNCTNNLSSAFFKNLGVSKTIINPELNETIINSIISNGIMDYEVVVYGNMELMYNNYCYLNGSNKCLGSCKRKCKNPSNFYLKDSLNNEFEILPNNLTCQTTIFNSKTLSIVPSLFNANSFRVDVLHETEDEIEDILKTVKSNSRFEGNCYTNGNLARQY